MKRLKFLVIDEADDLLNGRGVDDKTESVFEVIDLLPKKRQTFLYSATMNISDQILEKIGVTSPKKIYIGRDLSTVSTLSQKYVFISEHAKDCYLIYLLRLQEVLDAESNGEDIDKEEIMKPKKKMRTSDNDRYKGNKKDQFKEMMLTKRERQKESKVFTTVIVFAKTIRDTETIYLMCQYLGISTVRLHSRMDSKERKFSMAQFREGETRVLVASDVASRGLDIPHVGLVINYNMPTGPEIYIHRVGRTARAGRNGRAISLMTKYDVEGLHRVEDKLSLKMEELELEEKSVLRHMRETSQARALALAEIEKNNDDIENGIKSGKKRVIDIDAST